jgi:bacterioferritin
VLAGTAFPAWKERSPMKGNAEVLAVLQEVLKAELTAINQYFLHAEMMEHWGYKRLAKITTKESIEEMGHAEKCIERLLYLEATPNMSAYFKINIGDTVPKQYQNDLDLEYKAVERLNHGIALCTQKGDNGTRELLQKILTDEEHHVDYLETQIGMVKEMGLAAYLAEQVKED